jgi:hypothetical protein
MMSNRRSDKTSLLLVAVSLLVSNVAAFSGHQSSIRQSPLFGTSYPPMKQIHLAVSRGFEGDRRHRLPLFGKFLSRTTQQGAIQRISRLVNTFRKALATMCVSAMLLLGSGPSSPAYASPSLSSIGASIERVLPSATLDQMVTRYVKDHMFDEDTYDPVESIYREGYHDKTVGTYPKALKEIRMKVVGKEKEVKEEFNALKQLMGVTAALEKLGLSKQASLAIVCTTGIIGAPLILASLISSYMSFNKRRLVVSMKKRYGDDYSVDAAIKVVDEEDDVALDDGK